MENLEQDVPGAGSHVGHPHPVRLVDAGFCDALGMDHAQVNSFHNQGVTLAGLAPGLHAFALAEQDVVEGFTHPALGWTGMQWHPERPGSTVDLDRFLLGRWMGHSGGHG